MWIKIASTNRKAGAAFHNLYMPEKLLENPLSWSPIMYHRSMNNFLEMSNLT